MSYLTKLALATIASITGLGFYTYNSLLGNQALFNYAISLLGTSISTMVLYSYHLHYKTCQKHHQDQKEASQ